MSELVQKIDAFVKRHQAIPMIGVAVLTLGSLYIMSDLMKPLVRRETALKRRVETMKSNPDLRPKYIPVLSFL